MADSTAAIDEALAQIAARRRALPAAHDDLYIEDEVLLATADRLLERRRELVART